MTLAKDLNLMQNSIWFLGAPRYANLTMRLIYTSIHVIPIEAINLAAHLEIKAVLTEGAQCSVTFGFS